MNTIDHNLSDWVVGYIKRNHPGRDMAIPYKELMAIFAIPDDGKDNHGFRKLYENRVGSCRDGIYYIRTHAEALVWHGWLERTYHSKDLADLKLRAFLSMRPDLKPQAAPPAAQPKLFEEGAA